MWLRIWLRACVRVCWFLIMCVFCSSERAGMAALEDRAGCPLLAPSTRRMGSSSTRPAASSWREPTASWCKNCSFSSWPSSSSGGSAKSQTQFPSDLTCSWSVKTCLVLHRWKKNHFESKNFVYAFYFHGYCQNTHSKRLIAYKCRTEHHRKSILPVAIRLYNFSSFCRWSFSAFISFSHQFFICLLPNVVSSPAAISFYCIHNIYALIIYFIRSVIITG